VSFEFIATIASKLFAFKVEILENARSYPFLKSTHIYWESRSKLATHTT